jgi:predicted regulator of Ras-like GTPase activity (Roadblock/LC7/MglB family)
MKTLLLKEESFEMSKGKNQQLSEILQYLVATSQWMVKRCIVTNERGLVVASSVTLGPPEERLAAMASLLSETAKRITATIPLGNFQNADITTAEGSMLMQEFLVKGRVFRLIVILRSSTTTGRWAAYRRRNLRKDLWKRVSDATEVIRGVLEE